MKECKKCKKQKSLDEFGNKKLAIDGKNIICKDCQREYVTQLHNKKLIVKTITINDEKITIITKICANCNLEKDISDFNKNQAKCRQCQKEHAIKFQYIAMKIDRDKNPEKYKQWKKNYYENNKEKILAQYKEYRSTNKDNINQQQKDKYHKDIEESRRKNREYYKENREVRLENVKKSRERYPETRKNYIKNNKDRFRSYTRDRREKERNSKSYYSIKDERFTIEKFCNKCYRCLRETDLSIDHHYPLQDGFGLSIDNAVLLCRNCNSSKRQTYPEDFYTFGELNVLHSMGIMDLTEEIPNIENYKNDYY